MHVVGLCFTASTHLSAAKFTFLAGGAHVSNNILKKYRQQKEISLFLWKFPWYYSGFLLVALGFFTVPSCWAGSEEPCGTWGQRWYLWAGIGQHSGWFCMRKAMLQEMLQRNKTKSFVQYSGELETMVSNGSPWSWWVNSVLEIN